MDDIEQLLHRRTDLSTFLVHLTRDTAKYTARENLLRLITANKIIARTAFGMAVDHDELLRGTDASQEVVCFSETPLEHTWMMVREIAGRRHQFKPYGLVFTKSFARVSGCNPVWYLDITPGHTWLTGPIKELVEQAVEASRDSGGKVDAEQLASHPVFKLTPFIEQMGKPLETRKEFWWEREWRHAGDFVFRPRKVVAVFAPEAEHDDLQAEIATVSERWKKRRVPLLDPSWGLERMISALSGIDPFDAGPWPE